MQSGQWKFASRKRFRRRGAYLKWTIRTLERVKEKFIDFCKITSLHGFYHINNDITNVEKAFWIIVLIHVLVICGYQLIALIQIYHYHHIILVSSVSKSNVWDIPFPAITICSEYQLNKTLFQRLEMNESNSGIVRAITDYASFLNEESMSKESLVHELHESSLQYIFKHMPLSCDDLMVFVDWSTDYLPTKNICQYFQTSITPIGVCQTLNLLPLNQLFHAKYAAVLRGYQRKPYFYKNHSKDIQWTPENGFRSNEPLAPPWRVVGTGWFNSVRIVINTTPNNFMNLYSSSPYGTVVEVHSPNDHPKNLSPIRISPSTYTKVVVAPQINIASNDLIRWSPKVRGCYYEGEKWLKYYRVYTRQNCETECKRNQSMEFCGCVLFHAPRFAKETVCGIRQKSCLMQIGRTGYRKILSQDKLHYYDSNCQCLPACFRMNYYHRYYLLKRNLTNLIAIKPNLPPKFHNITVATLELFYKRGYVQQLDRLAMLSLPELFAKIGGIMSLFIGFSIVSLCEIFHKLSLNLYSKIIDSFKRNEISRSHRIATIFK